MKNTLLLTGLGLWFFATTITGQTQDSAITALSLQQAIDFTIKNQNSVKNATIDQEVAEKKVNEALGAGLPQINASFDTKDYFKLPSTVAPASFFGGKPGTYDAFAFGLPYQTTTGLDASMLLFSGDYVVGLQASKVYVGLTMKTLQRTKIDAAIAVSKAYYTALINQERLKQLDANIEQTKTAMDQTQSMLNNGFAEQVDYDRLVVTYNNLLIEKENTGRLFSVSVFLLKYQMGMNINANIMLTDKLEDIKFDVANNVNAEKFDYSKRIEYSIFETQFRVAQLTLRRNKFSYLPTASAYGNWSSNAYRPQFNVLDPSQKAWYPFSFIGATFKMPIFTGFQRNARTQQAKLGLQQAENNIDNIKKSIDYERASSMAMLQNASVSLENQRKNIALAQEVYRITKFKYEQGVGTNLELVTAENSLKQAQTNYLNALYNALIAKIDYDKANGNLKY